VAVEVADGEAAADADAVHAGVLVLAELAVAEILEHLLALGVGAPLEEVGGVWVDVAVREDEVEVAVLIEVGEGDAELEEEERGLGEVRRRAVVDEGAAPQVV